jgi:hypothetical protein
LTFIVRISVNDTIAIAVQHGRCAKVGSPSLFRLRDWVHM